MGESGCGIVDDVLILIHAILDYLLRLTKGFDCTNLSKEMKVVMRSRTQRNTFSFVKTLWDR